MNTARYSRIAHGKMPYHNPVPTVLVERFLLQLPLIEGARVLDIGCGNGGALRFLATHRDILGVGLDPQGEQLRPASSDHHLAKGTTLWVDAPYPPPRDLPGPWDAWICMGASHALGTAADVLPTAATHLVRGGVLLWGELFWRRAPSPGLLASLGCEAGDLPTFEGLQRMGGPPGWTLDEVYSCSPEDFDLYETAYRDHMAAFLKRHPEDHEAEMFRDHMVRWYDDYTAHRRAGLGFALMRWRHT